MESAQPTTDKFLGKALWYTTASAAVVIAILSLIGLTRSPLSQVVSVALASIVAVLIARHDISIYGTKFHVLAKDIIAFWGIAWLGLNGGIVIGLAGSLATCFAKRYESRRSALLICADTISNFVVGSCFFLALDYPAINGPGPFPFYTENAAAMVVLTALMAGVHFVVNATITYVRQYTTGERNIARQTIFVPMGSYFVTIGSTVLVNYTFLQFGLQFGLVLLPIAIIGNIAYAIHRQRLATKTREITEASRMHLATVEALATAIDARDQMGIGHVRRTQIFAVGIGEYLGLTESEISALRTAALLHDIGKLAVPDHILNKAGVLTDAEIEKTKIHSSVGASILEKVGFDTPVVPTVKYHHENWDGSGYPEGLRGENIPLTARILTVADAYDTLRGDRPYRPAVPRETAREILIRDAGEKYDPRLVKIFLENLDRFEAEIARQGLGFQTRAGDARLRKVAAGGQQNYVEQIKLANREAFTLYELAKEFSSSVNLAQTLRLFTDKIREFVYFDTCSVYLLDEDSIGAKSIHVAGKHAAIFSGHEVARGIGVTGSVLSSGIFARNCDPWPDLQLLRSNVTTDYRWMISLPMKTDERLIGAVSLYSTDAAGYSDEHLRLVETIGRIAADAIAKSMLHAEAESHALTDAMTGLPNARSLQSQFEREVARAHRSSSSFQVLMLDLDGFKQVNDTFGHKAGDQMLMEVGRVIKAQLREYDFLARYAGDEFVAIIPNSTGALVNELCRRIEKAVDDFELVIGNGVATVGVSIGAAVYPYSGEAFDQLLIAADKEMYAAKTRRKHDEPSFKMIPKPDRPLDFDMPIALDIDDIDTVLDNDEESVCATALN